MELLGAFQNDFLAAMPGLGAYVWQAGGDGLVWSPELLEIYEVAAAPVGEDAFYALVHPDDRTRVQAETSTFLGAGDRYSHVFRILRPDGEVRLIHDSGTIERDSSGRAVALRGINIDLTAQMAQISLLGRTFGQTASAPGVVPFAEAAGELDFAALLDHLPLIVWLHDETGRQRFVNQTFCDYFAVTRSEMREGRWQLLTHPGEGADYIEAFAEAVRRQVPFHAEVRVRRGDGAWRWFESWGRPMVDAGGRYKGHVGLSADVTDRKDAEEKRRMITRELTHRAKNLLSVVMAVARQTWRHSADGFMERFEQRLRAMADAQDALLEGGRGGLAVEALIRAQLGHLGEMLGSRICLSGPPVELAEPAVEPLAMALHELATNAGKYGALSGPSGEVQVRWALADGRFHLGWEERGGAPVRPPQRRGFGSEVIGPLIEARLGARAEAEFAEAGFRWRMECPASAVRDG